MKKLHAHYDEYDYEFYNNNTEEEDGYEHTYDPIFNRSYYVDSDY